LDVALLAVLILAGCQSADDREHKRKLEALVQRGATEGDVVRDLGPEYVKYQKGTPSWVMLLAKMSVFEALIVGHLAYDRATGQVGRHKKEITNFSEGLANCKTIFNKNCKCEIRPPRAPTPEEQAEIAKLLTAAAMLRMLIIILAAA